VLAFLKKERQNLVKKSRDLSEINIWRAKSFNCENVVEAIDPNASASRVAQQIPKQSLTIIIINIRSDPSNIIKTVKCCY